VNDSQPPKINLNEISDELQLEYPCRWLYKVIGIDEESVRAAVMELIDVPDVSIEPSNTSRTGKYVSINVEVTVVDQHQRQGFYEALRQHDAVRMVL
jgi:putative lipoic acid-binding regulatory protein